MYLVSKSTSAPANSFVAFSKNLVGISDVLFLECLGGSSTRKAVSYALVPLYCGGSSACMSSTYNWSNKLFKQIGFDHTLFFTIWLVVDFMWSWNQSERHKLLQKISQDLAKSILYKTGEAT